MLTLAFTINAVAQPKSTNRNRTACYQFSLLPTSKEHPLSDIL